MEIRRRGRQSAVALFMRTQAIQAHLDHQVRRKKKKTSFSPISEERVNNFAYKILSLDQYFDDMSFLFLLFYAVPVVAFSPMMLLMTIAFLWTHMMLLIR